MVPTARMLARSSATAPRQAMATRVQWGSLSIFGLLGVMSTGCTAETGPAPIRGDVPEATGWRAEVVVSGLEHPWSIAWLPDGAALVTERSGRLPLPQPDEDPESGRHRREAGGPAGAALGALLR